MKLTREEYRQINLLLLMVCLAAYLLVFTLVKARCFGSCGSELQLAYLNPLMYYAGGLSLILAVTYVSRRVIFREWLVYIASWYVPISIFFISQVNIRSDHMLAMDRGLAAAWWIGVLIVITVIYGVICVLYRWRRKENAY